MSNDIIEAIATILGIALAGGILYQVGSELPMNDPVNLQFMGILLVLMAILTAGALVYVTAKGVMPR